MTEREFGFATIRIKRLMEVKKERGGTSQKFKMWLININHGSWTTSFNSNNKRDFWRNLKRELKLRR